MQSAKKCADSCVVNLNTRHINGDRLAQSVHSEGDFSLHRPNGAKVSTHMNFDADVRPAEVVSGKPGIVPDDNDRMKVWQTLETRHSVQKHHLSLVGQHHDCNHGNTSQL